MLGNVAEGTENARSLVALHPIELKRLAGDPGVRSLGMTLVWGWGLPEVGSFGELVEWF